MDAAAPTEEAWLWPEHNKWIPNFKKRSSKNRSFPFLLARFSPPLFLLIFPLQRNCPFSRANFWRTQRRFSFEHLPFLTLPPKRKKKKKKATTEPTKQGREATLLFYLAPLFTKWANGGKRQRGTQKGKNQSYFNFFFLLALDNTGPFGQEVCCVERGPFHKKRNLRFWAIVIDKDVFLGRWREAWKMLLGPQASLYLPFELISFPPFFGAKRSVFKLALKKYSRSLLIFRDGRRFRFG